MVPLHKYIVNPKMRGSGMLGCIPQKGRCPNNCSDCFFQSGRSFLEPLDENTPNMPDIRDVELFNRVVRVNDGNDSNVNRALVISKTKQFTMKFYNTSIPRNLEEFDAPVVLTVNPSYMTDKEWHKIDPIPTNLMFVRIRTNTWNIFDVVYPTINYYTEREVPVVLTFMAYYDTPEKIPLHHKKNYKFMTRTLNKYFAITTKAWEEVMYEFRYNKWVYSCSKIEGEKGTHACHRCGNCLREYFYTMEKIRGSEL